MSRRHRRPERYFDVCSVCIVPDTSFLRSGGRHRCIFGRVLLASSAMVDLTRKTRVGRRILRDFPGTGLGRILGVSFSEPILLTISIHDLAQDSY